MVVSIDHEMPRLDCAVWVPVAAPSMWFVNSFTGMFGDE